MIERLELNEDVLEELRGLGITGGKEVIVKGHDAEKTFRFR
ncbi:hypothetical protein [Thermococcus sp. Bubb.Bath]|nr:hypothetical protein [Thermococcus sp. Bubb.Bath]